MTKHMISLADVRNQSWGTFKDPTLARTFQRTVKGKKIPKTGTYVSIVAQGGVYALTGEIVRGFWPPDGMITLSESEFRKLTERASYEKTWPSVFSSTLRFDDLLGNARAAFDGSPDSDKWTLLLETLDQCHPDDLDRLIDYIEPQLQQWDDRQMPKWDAPRQHPLTRFTVPSWSNGLPDTELRVAPPRWIFEMTHGKYSRKHSLIRGLNLERMKINWSVMKKILANPHLRNLTELNLGDNAVCHAKTFYKNLRTHDIMRSVKTLTIYAIVTTFDDAIALLNGPDHSFDSLQTVDYRYSKHYTFLKDIGKQMMSYPCFQGAQLSPSPTNASTFEYIS